MKKKIFLSGVNAKLALAAVALTSVMFTSCEKEEFNVAPVELDPASATVAITVYDLSDGSIINGASITENGAAITSNPFVIEAGSDGKIAAATRTFAATKDEYLSGEGQATVPALNKGQFALIPVSIFLQQELNAAEDVVVDQDEETITPSEVGGEQKGGENTSSKEKKMDLPYTAKVGQEVTNIAAVNASIDAMPITRGLSDDEVKKVLKALVKSYSPGITDVTYTKKVTVPAYTIVTLKTTTEYETSDNTISTVVDGKLYTIPNVKIKKVVKTVVDPVFTSTEHGHGHGHGNGNNAGGGDGAADAGERRVAGAHGVRLIGGPRAGKRRTLSALDFPLLCGAGGAAVHPLCPAEPGRKGAAAVFQCHRVPGQGGVRAGVHPPLCLQCGDPLRAGGVVLHGAVSGGGIPLQSLCVPQKTMTRCPGQTKSVCRGFCRRFCIGGLLTGPNSQSC